MAHLGNQLSRRPPSRIAIIGGPRTGKTTLALGINRSGQIRTRGTDELIGLGWSESSLVASSWFEYPGPWIHEGVTTARALRKWLTRNPGAEQPTDLIVVTTRPVAPTSRHQDAMSAGIATVFAEILPELERRGVEIINA